jgi:hypothetical protein
MTASETLNKLTRVTEAKLEEFKADCEAEMETLGARVERKVMTVYEDLERSRLSLWPSRR